MAIGDIIEIRVEGIAALGAGVGRANGRAVFVDYTAPGDSIAARIIEERKDFLRAETVEIIEPSLERVKPLCPLFGRCGGCSLQHLSYDAQLKAKVDILSGAFTRIGAFQELPIIATIPSAPYEYRNRMQFHRVGKRRSGDSPVGLKRAGSEEVLPVRDCPVADPRIRAALAEGALKPQIQSDRFTVYGRGNLLLSEGGVERGKVRLLDKELTMDVRGFFQSNAAVLEKLIVDLKAAAALAAGESEGEAAADLYCGVGTFALFLKDLFPRIDLLERDKGALALARENVRGPQVRHFALSDDEWAKLKGNADAGERYGFVTVDPPRVGLSAALRRRLAELRPRTIAYVSCDPATLARDAKDLVAAGYRLNALSCYDFYPQTPHVEALALFGSGS